MIMPAPAISAASKRPSIFKAALRYPVNKVIACSVAANYYLGNYREVVWLLGDGRSGTTWVSNIINWSGRYREMFEPFHPKLVKGMHGFAFHQYVRPDETDPYFSQRIRAVFTGKFRDSRVDRDNHHFFYRGLLIKDIFANLLLGWVQCHIPDVKKILLVRNPFAVAFSKYRKKDWIWMTDPKEFLHQKSLYEDYLAPFDDIIRGVGDDAIERHLMIWAIIHYIPFKQLKRDQVYVLFYEALQSNPRPELARLFRYLYGDQSPEIGDPILARLAIPSVTAGDDSNVAQGKSPVTAWKEQASPQHIAKGLSILASFGLDQLYGTDSMPRTQELERLLS